MSSSTSSFKDFLKVLVFICITICCAEALIRAFALPKSQSYKVISDVRTASAQIDPEKITIAVFGNSFTLHGIDTEKVACSPALEEANLHVNFHALSGSGLCEWYWMAKQNYFYSESTLPDYVVINADPKSLMDRWTIRHRNLAMILGPTKGPLLPRNDLDDTGKISEFLIARFAMCISRGRNLGDQILTRIVPSYQKNKKNLASREIQSSRSQEEKLDSVSDKKKNETGLERLRRLCNACQVNNVKLCVVFMPHRDGYELEPEIQAVLRDYSVDVIDNRSVEKIHAEHFQDATHMNEAGKALYTSTYLKNLLIFINN